jgi:hypothetical protein
MKELSTAIDIAASPWVVWGVLTDLSSFEDWNPFIVRAEGEVERGAPLRLRMRPPGGREMTFRPRVTSVEPERELEWLGHLGVPGLFDGRHHFLLEATATGSRLVQSEMFTGVLVRPLSKSLDTGARQGFVAMNEALRNRAEARAKTGA